MSPNPVHVTAAFDAVRTAFGPVGILVTSAALGGFTRFDRITLEEWNRYLAVNLTGTFLCMQNALADMVGAEWGRIVTISSAAGQKGASRQGHYSATKGGVIALTKSVALDYAAKGITVNTVPPFVVDTPMLREQQRDESFRQLSSSPRQFRLAGLAPARTSPRCADSSAQMPRAISPDR